MHLFRNFKSVTKTCYGRGSFGKLDEILAPHRKVNQGFMVFVVDDYFEHKTEFTSRIPALKDDEVRFISVLKEPTTDLIDSLRDDILSRRGLPAGIVGIGGGSVMDIAKAASLMFTN